MKNTNIYFVILTFGVLFVGCKKNPRSTGIEYAPQMYHALAYEPFRQQEKDILSGFKDGNSMQLPPEHTVARGQWNTIQYNDSTADKVRAGLELKNPVALTPEILKEGEVLFNRYCAVCHGATGKGNGTVIEGAHDQFPPPPKYQSRKAYPEGKVFHTITFGQVNMGSYAYALSQEERWKVAHYVGKLQDDLNPAEDSASVAKAEAPKAAPNDKDKPKHN